MNFIYVREIYNLRETAKKAEPRNYFAVYTINTFGDNFSHRLYNSKWYMMTIC